MTRADLLRERINMLSIETRATLRTGSQWPARDENGPRPLRDDWTTLEYQRLHRRIDQFEEDRADRDQVNSAIAWINELSPDRQMSVSKQVQALGVRNLRRPWISKAEIACVIDILQSAHPSRQPIDWDEYAKTKHGSVSSFMRRVRGLADQKDLPAPARPTDLDNLPELAHLVLSGAISARTEADVDSLNVEATPAVRADLLVVTAITGDNCNTGVFTADHTEALTAFLKDQGISA